MANQYKICIHISRSNAFVGRIENVPFVSAPAGESDTIIYTR